MHIPAHVRLAAALIALTTVLAGCGGAGGAPPPASPRASPPGPGGSEGDRAERAVAAVTAMCEVKRQARADVESASATFYDQAHANLHATAAAVQEVDRPAAGRLLEAKQRLEADLAAGKGRGVVARDADLLLAATIDALGALGVRIRSCPP